ncbi:unnamed protein product [Penicillium crustosum]
MADLRLHAENGEFIIVLDDQDRENKADLIIAAESITPAQMAFLVREDPDTIHYTTAPKEKVALGQARVLLANC